MEGSDLAALLARVNEDRHRLTGERDRARGTAAHLEALIARALDIHAPLPHPYAQPWCVCACEGDPTPYPCSTARALGVEP